MEEPLTKGETLEENEEEEEIHSKQVTSPRHARQRTLHNNICLTTVQARLAAELRLAGLEDAQIEAVVKRMPALAKACVSCAILLVESPRTLPTNTWCRGSNRAR